MKTTMPHVDPAWFSPSTYSGPPASHWPGRIWHYTTSHATKRIVAAGALTPMPQRYVSRETPLGKKNLLWFSKNHIWEPAACHTLEALTFEWNGQRFPKALDFQGMQGLGTKLVRFAVDERSVPYSHATAFHLAGYSTKQSRWLEQVGEQLGSTCTDWRGTLDPVPQADWLAIEIWHVDHWRLAWEP